jgi:hypothetical protein
MHRMWIRALLFAAIGAITVLAVDDARAGHRRRGCGSSGGSYGGYYSDGYTYGGNWSSGGYYTWSGDMQYYAEPQYGWFGRFRGYAYRPVTGGYAAPGTAGVSGEGEIRSARRPGEAGQMIEGQRSPSDRGRLEGSGQLRGGADVNRSDGTIRNDGTIRGGAEADVNLRGSTTPPEAPTVPRTNEESDLPPPAPRPNPDEDSLPPPAPAP